MLHVVYESCIANKGYQIWTPLLKPSFFCRQGPAFLQFFTDFFTDFELAAESEPKTEASVFFSSGIFLPCFTVKEREV